ncbi:retrotransposon protein, putative, ty1-copia subclass [Tanacetum coccineum]
MSILGHPSHLPCCESDFIGIRKEFDGFVQNYNMHSLGKTVNELHAMLKLHEQTLTLPKNNAPALHAIRAGKVQKGSKGASRKLKTGGLLTCTVGNGQRELWGAEFNESRVLIIHGSWGLSAHRTPPYTPQHKWCVGEENRTLLVMVRLLYVELNISSKVLLWDYALETAARIINMVPTKKVEKTPYEVWPHGQALAVYLKVQRERRPSRSTYVYTSMLREHELGDLGVESRNYKAALLDPESVNGLQLMECGMQSMKDNEVGFLVEIPPNGKPFVSHGDSKRGSIPMQDKLRLSKSQGASTPAELKRMQNVPYASLRVSCYTDAGYLTDADDLKSQTGYVFILNGGVVDWKSAKQSIFATSSAEAEYIGNNK